MAEADVDADPVVREKDAESDTDSSDGEKTADEETTNRTISFAIL